MIAALAAGAAAFSLTLLLGYPYLLVLRRAGVAKLVRPDELASHFGKTGTLTMGGVLFTFTIALLTAGFSVTLYRDAGHSILLPLAVLVTPSMVGGYDDRLSLVGSRGGGLSGRAKFLLLGVIGLVAALVLRDPDLGLGIDFVFIPGVRAPVSLGWLIVPRGLNP